MADRTSIEWTDATWNVLRGCSRVSQGCVNCYAEVMAARFSKPGQWGHGRAEMVQCQDGSVDHRWTGKVAFVEDALDLPLRWKKPRRIFVNSTSDLFHESVPDDWIDRVFAVMALCPRHTFQVLTKRPERAQAYLTNPNLQRDIEAAAGAWLGEDAECFVANWINGWSRPQEASSDSNPANGTVRRWPLPNVWIGTSVEDQKTADERIPKLLAAPAAVRFVSAEPLLGPVKIFNNDIGPDPDGLLLDWVIVGGESGPGARPMHPDWARDLRDQCVSAGTPFFFKQWGEWGPASIDAKKMPQISFAPYTPADQLAKHGKAKAGRTLDGRTWDQMPRAFA
ncbi:DUF5131 family protein [Rhodobacter sp. 24-YEA-8]|uniref:DUF5131 family protein n=1 Tax=Rhodobacter sp. 24-YEA-8 TaxID=1884310 RepID=UPI00089D4BBD|nr:phage Gp37/Gp68 family protein [Rhodobacter sp. 24-YEA-8]SEB77771.1 protein gp37 [Rhodobacter sp. 24-YEA-8]